jgi:apolipoprotein D and lipocalin family protein
MMLWSCGQKENLEYVVPNLDLEQFSGTWYEIARFDHPFERGLISNKAQYTLRDDGKIDVVNSGIQSDNPEKTKTAKAVGYRASDKNNGHLKVSFFRPFSAHYLVIDLDEDYQYAVVTSTSKKYLWILSRKKTMDEDLYTTLTNRLREQGFRVEDLIRVQQL